MPLVVKHHLAHQRLTALHLLDLGHLLLEEKVVAVDVWGSWGEVYLKWLVGLDDERNGCHGLLFVGNPLCIIGLLTLASFHKL